MMESQELYNLFDKHINKPENHTDAVWTSDSFEVYWNEDGVVDDLLEGEGETYSSEIRRGGVEIGDYILYNLRDCTGCQYQAIFDLRKKWVKGE